MVILVPWGAWFLARTGTWLGPCKNRDPARILWTHELSELSAQSDISELSELSELSALGNLMCCCWWQEPGGAAALHSAWPLFKGLTVPKMQVDMSTLRTFSTVRTFRTFRTFRTSSTQHLAVLLLVAGTGEAEALHSAGPLFRALNVPKMQEVLKDLEFA